MDARQVLISLKELMELTLKQLSVDANSTANTSSRIAPLQQERPKLPQSSFNLRTVDQDSASSNFIKSSDSQKENTVKPNLTKKTASNAQSKERVISTRWGHAEHVPSLGRPRPKPSDVSTLQKKANAPQVKAAGIPSTVPLDSRSGNPPFDADELWSFPKRMVDEIIQTVASDPIAVTAKTSSPNLAQSITLDEKFVKVPSRISHQGNQTDYPSENEDTVQSLLSPDQFFDAPSSRPAASSDKIPVRVEKADLSVAESPSPHDNHIPTTSIVHVPVDRVSGGLWIPLVDEKPNPHVPLSHSNNASRNSILSTLPILDVSSAKIELGDVDSLKSIRADTLDSQSSSTSNSNMVRIQRKKSSISRAKASLPSRIVTKVSEPDVPLPRDVADESNPIPLLPKRHYTHQKLFSPSFDRRVSLNYISSSSNMKILDVVNEFLSSTFVGCLD